MAEENPVEEVVINGKPRPKGAQVFKPQISITLKKVIGRKLAGTVSPDNPKEIAASERFKESAREIDLSPYFGEGCQVSVQRSTRAPAGMWSVTLVDRMVPDQYESLYGLIEPMDIVEIRMARDVSPYAGQLPLSMPLMMRGFVSKIRRTTVMTQRGPRRAVVMSGQDYGKILQMMRVEYRFGQVIGQNLLTALKLAVNYGVDSQPYADAGEFIVEIIDKVINTGDGTGFLATMRDNAAPGVASPVQDIAVLASPGNGEVTPFGAQDWSGGSIYDLLRTFGDVGAWNELYIEDREEGPYLIYRPTPFRDLEGEYIQKISGENLPPTVDIFGDQIVNLEMERSDENVANAFYVNAPRYDLVDGTLLKAAELVADDPSGYVLLDYANSTPKLYGFRVMEDTTNQGRRTDGQPEAEYEAGNQAGIGLTTIRREVLIRNNRDNVVLESGGIQMRGDERVQHGSYLRVSIGGDFTMNVYAHTVTHSFAFGGNYMTAVDWDRGDGFVQRLKRERTAGGPYLSELKLGGAYG